MSWSHCLNQSNILQALQLLLLSVFLVFSDENATRGEHLRKLKQILTVFRRRQKVGEDLRNV